MSHHEVLDSVQKGTHVILTRHSNSERGFLEVAATKHLKTRMPEVGSNIQLYLSLNGYRQSQH